MLEIWYGLSDVQLAQCLYRDLLFRKFCRFELGGNVPEASTLGRFRTQLVKVNLWDRLLAEINDQLRAKNIIMTPGRINIMDVTPIEAAQSGSGKGVDEDSFIHRQSVTAGNTHNSQEHDALLLGDEVALYADAAYSSQDTRD